MSANDVRDDYAYDVFISYPRRLYQESPDDTEHVCGQWLRSSFLPFFKSCLSDIVPYAPQIFMDVENLRAGDAWQEVIRAALRASRCLVPVWSAPYFRSRFCLWEWQSFQRRGANLVVPIGWTKPLAFFPAEARATQIYDFSRYAFPNPGLTASEKGMPFYETIRDFAQAVADKMLVAPAFDGRDARFEPVDVPTVTPPRPKIHLVPLGAPPVTVKAA
jgi:hypothetical protein